MIPYNLRYNVSQRELANMFLRGKLMYVNIYKDELPAGYTPFEYWLHLHPDGPFDLSRSDNLYEMIGDTTENKVFIVDTITGEARTMLQADKDSLHSRREISVEDEDDGYPD